MLGHPTGGIHGGMPEHFIHAGEHPVGDGVFEHFRLAVYHVPIETEDFHQEKLDEAVPAHHLQGDALTGLAQADAPPRGS